MHVVVEVVGVVNNATRATSTISGEGGSGTDGLVYRYVQGTGDRGPFDGGLRRRRNKDMNDTEDLMDIEHMDTLIYEWKSTLTLGILEF